MPAGNQAGPGLVHLPPSRSRGGRDGSEVGIGDGHAVESSAETQLKLRWVRGINSRPEEMKVRGSHLEAILGNAVLEATLLRRIKGASSLTVTVADPGSRLVNKKLLNEAHQLTLDGLRFRLVKSASQGLMAPLELTYEPEVVWLLRAIKGPHKAFRDRVTRAEFIKRLVAMAKPQPRFIAPDLHVIQPIAAAKEATAAAGEALDERRGGITKGQKFTVKGVAATPGQVEAADRALRVAEGESAPRLAKVAMMLALIVEGVLGVASKNWYGAEDFIPGDHEDLEAMTKLFLTGYNSGEPGAIGEAQKHPSSKAYEITQSVQASGAGAPSGGADNYGPWTKEAEAFVDSFGGPESDSTSVTTTVRYAFKQGEKESNWACALRLANEVKWDFFESAGWIYFASEPTLLRQKVRMQISPTAEAVVDLSFDYDVGKEAQTVSVEAYAHAWEAPPGSAVQVSGLGPANGVYLVETIEAPVSARVTKVTITLKRPTEALPEPAAASKTTEVGGTGATEAGSGQSPRTPAGAPAAIDAMLVRMEELEGTPYEMGGGHGGFEDDPAKLDCSGAMCFALHAAGLIDEVTVSGTLAGMYEAGRGKWLAIYANGEHVFCEILTKDGWVEWEEGGVKGDCGFLAAGSHPKGGFSVRHPKGL